MMRQTPTALMRQTLVARMKPYIHHLSPGARASEKGMLYRNNNMNMHARVAAIQQAQRTAKEAHIFLMLLVPDQTMMASLVFIAVAFCMVVMNSQQSFSFNTHKQRWMLGALNEHEFFTRNSEMARVLASHQEMIDNTRKEIGECPNVLLPPEHSEYESKKYMPVTN